MNRKIPHSAAPGEALKTDAANDARRHGQSHERVAGRALQRLFARTLTTLYPCTGHEQTSQQASQVKPTRRLDLTLIWC
jgi:hypothetical protein